MSRTVSPTLIGGFVVGAITLGVAGLIFFSSGPLFRKSEPFVLFFEGSVSGLRTGAPVKFKGVEVGEVTGVYLDMGGSYDDTVYAIPVTIELFEDRIRARGGQADLDDPDWIESTIEAGIRGQLLTESLVTGRLYVALDMHPGSQLVLRGGPDTPYPEIPTLPTPFEEIQRKASEFIAKLQTLEVDSLLEALTETFEGTNRLVNSPNVAEAVESLDNSLKSANEAMVRLESLLAALEEDVVPVATSIDSTRTAATATLREAQLTLEQIRILLEPGSPLTYRLEHALTELSAAAQALQAFADYLERNPGALVRGREVTEEKQ
ncbi:MAG: MlaD family protein [Gemmatimonadales bacterium]|jgi:paraquat-inducible protein B